MGKQSPQSILIVEDESSLNEAYQIILANAGYDIYSAFDGQEALEVVAQKEPSLILLDLRMPVMDGLEFMKQYIANHPKGKTKIIVFSNYDMQTEVDEAFKLGADRYILKAWASPKELLRLVKDTLSGSAKKS